VTMKTVLIIDSDLGFVFWLVRRLRCASRSATALLSAVCPDAEVRCAPRNHEARSRRKSKHPTPEEVPPFPRAE